MNTLVRFLSVLIISVLLLYPAEGHTAEPPAGPVSLALTKSGKPKFKPTNYSTFLTFNVENIQFQRSDPFFHYQNLAYGLKIGTMRNSGWYLSVMSNFNFNGLFKTVDDQNINPLTNSLHSYVDGLFGLTFRSFKPASFHIGVGYHYRTTNYRSLSGSWGHLSTKDAHGPMAAAGLMFHISGFVLSAEAVANYNLKAPNFKEGLGVGFKLGIGFCVEHKKSSKKTKKRVSDKMSNSELRFSPTTAGPEEYDVIFRHTYTKPKPEIVMIIEKDTLLSKLPQLEYFNSNRMEEEKLVDEPVHLSDTIVKTVSPPTPVPSRQEEAAHQENSSVNVADTVKPVGAHPEKKIVHIAEKQQEMHKEKQPKELTELLVEQGVRNPLQKSDPVHVASVGKEAVVDTFVMPPAPVPPCKELSVRDVDGNAYHTLAIGNQCWLRENMRTTRFANGDSVKLARSFDFQRAVRYFPGGDSSMVDEFGYLYNWNAVSHTAATNGSERLQGICPDGWHIPAMMEWEELFGYLAGQSAMSCQGDSQYVAKALAAKTDWGVSEMDCAIGNRLSLNNASGFHALPAGMFLGKFDFFGKVARFWSSSIGHAQGKCDVYMSWDEAVVKKSDQEPAVVAFSVRCLKD